MLTDKQVTEIVNEETNQYMRSDELTISFDTLKKAVEMAYKRGREDGQEDGGGCCCEHHI